MEGGTQIYPGGSQMNECNRKRVNQGMNGDHGRASTSKINGYVRVSTKEQNESSQLIAWKNLALNEIAFLWINSRAGILNARSTSP